MCKSRSAKCRPAWAHLMSAPPTDIWWCISTATCPRENTATFFCNAKCPPEWAHLMWAPPKETSSGSMTWSLQREALQKYTRAISSRRNSTNDYTEIEFSDVAFLFWSMLLSNLSLLVRLRKRRTCGKRNVGHAARRPGSARGRIIRLRAAACWVAQICSEIKNTHERAALGEIRAMTTHKCTGQCM